MRHTKSRFNVKCPSCGGHKSAISRQCRKCAHPHPNRPEQVIKAIAEDKTIKEIAFELKLSPKTVEYWWSIAKAKYGFQSYVGAVKYAIKHQMIGL